MFKGVVITLSVIFLLAVIGFGTVSYKYSKFEDAHQAEAIQLLIDLSENWNLDDIATRIDNEADAIMRSANSLAAIKSFETNLGRFVEAREVKLLNYHSTTHEGTTGAFLLKARFEKATAEVKIILRKKDDQAKLVGLLVDNIAGLTEAPSEV